MVLHLTRPIIFVSQNLTFQQIPGTAGPGNMLSCCLDSFHFLWAILCAQDVLLRHKIRLNQTRSWFLAGIQVAWWHPHSTVKGMLNARRVVPGYYKSFAPFSPPPPCAKTPSFLASANISRSGAKSNGGAERNKRERRMGNPRNGPADKTFLHSYVVAVHFPSCILLDCSTSNTQLTEKIPQESFGNLS